MIDSNAIPDSADTSRETASAGDRVSEMLARLRRLEADHPSVASRAQTLLETLQHGHGAIAAALTLGVRDQELDCVSDGGPEGIEAWHGEMKAAALDARSHGYPVGRVYGDGDKPRWAVLSTPLESSSGEPIGGVALLLPWQDEAHARAMQSQLRSIAAIGASSFAKPPVQAARVEMDDFARVLARAGSYKTVQQFAYALTNSAKQRFGCDQAALGLATGGSVRVVCISGLDHVKERSPGVHHIQQAMGECLDAQAPLIAQPKEQWADDASAATGLLHERWRSACAGSCVLSVPLVAGDVPVGVLSLARHADDPFRPEEIEALTKLVAPLSAAVPVVHKSTRSLPSHARSTIHDGYRWLTKPGTRPRQLAMVAATLFVLWFTFKPTMYRVTTQASVIAGREVVVASGLDGTVAQVLVRSGDRVIAGQPLVRLDTSTMVAQRAQLASEVENATLRFNNAIANSDPAIAAIAQAERDASAASLQRINEQIDLATVVSPIDGIVVSSNISDLTGSLVPVGEALLTIADESTLELELELPERRVTDLAESARVRFASHARPEDAAIVTLTHVEPAATVRDGRSVFLAQADLPAGQGWLRPGMEGVAIVEAGRKPNWWLGLRRAIDFAHLNFWIE
ncbi:MAG: HlyD family efflux transporter periplasmic adaptor subunit [Phycisphaerales bacterium JB064]